MLDNIKFTILVWAAIYLLIFLFVIAGLWAICSLWWLITNNMIDRNTFMFISLGVTKLIALLIVVLGLLPEKK